MRNFMELETCFNLLEILKEEGPVVSKENIDIGSRKCEINFSYKPSRILEKYKIQVEKYAVEIRDPRNSQLLS